MNRLLILPVLLLTLLVGTPAFSADFQKGLTAYQSGDYATALREWTPLAKQGYATPQYNLGQMYRKGDGVPTRVLPSLPAFCQTSLMKNLTATICLTLLVGTLAFGDQNDI